MKTKYILGGIGAIVISWGFAYLANGLNTENPLGIWYWLMSLALGTIGIVLIVTSLTK